VLSKGHRNTDTEIFYTEVIFEINGKRQHSLFVEEDALHYVGHGESYGVVGGSLSLYDLVRGSFGFFSEIFQYLRIALLTDLTHVL